MKLLRILIKVYKSCLNKTFNKAFKELLYNYYNIKKNLKENGNKISDIKINNNIL